LISTKYEINGDNLGDMEEDDDIYAKVDLVDGNETVRITTDYFNATKTTITDDSNTTVIASRKCCRRCRR
jgi:radical SAM superfamily enzyme YgiQ (UPF0313 family)